MKLEVKGIGTCKVDLCIGRSLMFPDILYTPEIRRNIVFVSILLNVCFNLLFSRNSARITLDNVLYGFRLHYDSFTILDCDPSTGMITRKPFGKIKRFEFPYQLIHFDICCQKNVKANSCTRYYNTFIDDFMLFG